MAHTYSDSDKSTNIVGVALIAGMMGAIAGLLFAPKRGDEMREDLKDRYKDMKTKSQSGVDNAKHKIADTADVASSKVKQAADKTRETVYRGADKAKETADKATAKTKSAADDATDRSDTIRPVL